MFRDVVALANFIGMDVMDDPMLAHILGNEWATGTVEISADEQTQIDAQVDAFLKKIAE